MHLTLSTLKINGRPGQYETTITVTGDTITVDGTAYDLSAVPEGGEATPQGEGHPFINPITRQSGVIHATISVQYDNTAENHQPTDPSHWVIPDADGEVTIPAARKDFSDV